MEFCLNNAPNLKQLDMRKVTKEMRSDPASATFEDSDKIREGGMGSLSQNGTDLSTATATQSDVINTNILMQNSSASPLPSISKTTTQPQVNANQEDISPEGLLKVISQEWVNEMERIRSLGLNGYKRRKESRSEWLVQSGHAEIEGDNKLFIYGNALEVLSNPDF